MTRCARLFAILLFCLTAALDARGLGLPGLGGARVADPVKVRALVSASPLVAGTNAQIALEVRIDPRYHIQSSYAPPPNNVAAQFKKLAAPEGITFGEIRYPKPKTIPMPAGVAGTQSVYDGEIYFLIPITISIDAKPGPATLQISLETQACTDKSCDLPQTAALQIPVTIAPAGTASKPANSDLFSAAQAQDFAPAPPATAPATTASQSTTPPATPTAAGPGHAVTLLSIPDQQSLITARDYSPFNAADQHHSLAAIFLFALLGGLILNVMPCVLPVIPLKALSLVQQAHGDRRVAVLHGLVFSAGIVTLFVALAILLRSFGMFYGQQFQSTAFLIAMTYLVVALALSMLGVWTINPPQALYAADARISDSARRFTEIDYASAEPRPRHDFTTYAASFGNGLLATLLATPCSAPFLGAVLAWALIQPTWIAAFTLAIVGVGMGLPYLLLAAFPGILARFPRAGRWSELLKQGLGILMLFVAVYLATLVRDVRLWPWVLAGALVLALICWGWGQIPSPLMAASRIWTIRVTVLVLGIFLGAGVWKIGASVAASQDTAIAPAADTAFLPDGPSDNWLPFNMALLDEGLQEGRPVVVDWTADWCINCRALEATVLSDDSVKSAFRQKNALLLRADVSGASPAEWALLRKLGFQSIPVSAVFQPRDPLHPIVLPDLYTSSSIIADVSAAK